MTYAYCHYCHGEGVDLRTQYVECGDCGAYCVEICEGCHTASAACPDAAAWAGGVAPEDIAREASRLAP